MTCVGISTQRLLNVVPYGMSEDCSRLRLATMQAKQVPSFITRMLAKYVVPISNRRRGTADPSTPVAAVTSAQNDSALESRNACGSGSLVCRGQWGHYPEVMSGMAVNCSQRDFLAG